MSEENTNKPAERHYRELKPTAVSDKKQTAPREDRPRSRRSRGRGRRPSASGDTRQTGDQQQRTSSSGERSGNRQKQNRQPRQGERSEGNATAQTRTKREARPDDGRRSDRSGQSSRRGQRGNRQQTARTERGNTAAKTAPEATVQQTVRPDAETARAERPKKSRWKKKQIKAEETYADIKRSNEQLIKEIWLDIASIHTIRLDF